MGRVAFQDCEALASFLKVFVSGLSRLLSKNAETNWMAIKQLLWRGSFTWLKLKCWENRARILGERWIFSKGSNEIGIGSTPIASRDFTESLICAPFIIWHSWFYFKGAKLQLSSMMGTFFRARLKFTLKSIGKNPLKNPLKKILEFSLLISNWA